MPAKQYPLDVQSVGSGTYIAMSKGHHDLKAFMAEAVKECPGWFLGGPQHKWCKKVPDRSGEFAHRYVFVEEGAPGAWPATYCWSSARTTSATTPRCSHDRMAD